MKDSTTARMFAHAYRGQHVEENRPMHMATKIKRWTRADLERLPDDGNKYELLDGELLVTPLQSPRHEELRMVFTHRLTEYVERAAIGRVYAGNPSVVTPDSQIIPDLLVRRPIMPIPATWDEATTPVLVVEILSAFTRRRDLFAKKAFYMKLAIPEYWMVDDHDRSLRVVSAAGERVEKQTVSWLPAGAAEEFVLDVAAFFHEALGAVRGLG